ncbi:hypothetical protein Tco_1066252 [Tanacetum coccineum]|uniref:Uncharacterized protein n=1 Tax=Tanacetum coccineum TaxID=301880 RepID=A0ABQ5HA38_9ASTR
MVRANGNENCMHSWNISQLRSIKTPCITTFDVVHLKWGGNMEMEPDIENMTLDEYREYEAEKERRLWDNDRFKNSPKRTGAENIKRMGHEIVQDSIWEHDDYSEEDQEEDGDDEDTFDMWDIMVKDVERIKNFFNIPDEIDKIVQLLIP